MALLLLALDLCSFATGSEEVLDASWITLDDCCVLFALGMIKGGDTCVLSMGRLSLL